MCGVGYLFSFGAGGSNPDCANLLYYTADPISEKQIKDKRYT